MASNFSNIFGSDNNEQDTHADVNTDQNADLDTDASNSGIMLESESYSRDEDGSESYDRQSLDTGETDLGNSLDLDNMVDGLLNSSSSSGDTEILDS